MVTDGLRTKEMSNETADQKWLKALAGRIAGKAATSHLEIEAKRIQPPAGAWITLVIDAAKVAPQ